MRRVTSYKALICFTLFMIGKIVCRVLIVVMNFLACLDHFPIQFLLSLLSCFLCVKFFPFNGNHVCLMSWDHLQHYLQHHICQMWNPLELFQHRLQVHTVTNPPFEHFVVERVLEFCAVLLAYIRVNKEFVFLSPKF